MTHAGYVYIVHGIGTHYIRVGTTTDIERRLRQVREGLPFRVRILLLELVHDMESAERLLKARYGAFRTRGAWFELSDEALAVWPSFLETVHPSQAPAIRLVPTKPALSQRILTLLERGEGMTIRTMTKHLHGMKAAAIQEVIPLLLGEGTLQAQRVGKTTLYRITATEKALA